MRFWICALAWVFAACAADHAGFVRCAGEPVAGAVVVARNSGTEIRTTTDESGLYVLRDLTPGTWEITVRLFGFRTAAQIIVVGASDEPLEWRLTVESPLDDVAGQRHLKDREREKRPAAMPPEDLAALVSDAAAAEESVMVSGSLSRGLELAPREDELSKMRAEWVKDEAKGPPLPGAPKAEKQVAGVSGRFEAPGDFAGFGGPAAGGGIPKPKPPKAEKGKKEPHGVSIFGNRVDRWRDKVRGSLHASLRHSSLDARPYAANGQEVEKAPYSIARAGISFGGPLAIPKLLATSRTFFFLSFTTVRSRNPFHGAGTVPDSFERAGDFAFHEPGMRGVIFDPSAAAPFPLNRIPASRFARASLGLLEYIPLPNQSGSARNYQLMAASPQTSQDLAGRVNHSLGASDHVDVSVASQWRSSDPVQLFGFRDRNEGLGFSAGLSWLHSLGGKSVNNLRLSFSRNRSQVTPFFAYQRDVAKELGIDGVSRAPVNYGPPNLRFTNYAALSGASAQLRRDRSVSVNNSLKWHREEHKVDAGIEFRRTHTAAITDQDARGTLVFSGLATSRLDAAGQPIALTGWDFADFLLGLPQSGSIRFDSSDSYFRGWAVSGWLQDDWKPLPGFSLKYGLRYEFFAPPSEKFGRMTNLDAAPGFTAVAPVTAGGEGPFSGRFPAALVDSDPNNVSPRVGLAWRPFSGSKFHIRSGYGVFFDGSIYQRFPPLLASQPPFAKASVITTTVDRPLTIATAFTQAVAKPITNTVGVARRYRSGYAQTWNFSIKHDLPHRVGLEAGYLGTKGTRLNVQRLPNRAAPGSPLTAEQRRQIANAVGFTWESSEGNSIFHAAQVKIIRHFHRGLAAEALYTFSKAIDNAATFGGSGGTPAQDDRNLRAERGLADFDQRHRLGASFLWASPFGDAGTLLRGRGWRSTLFGNITAGGALICGSGTPFTARVLGNRADAGGTGAIGAGRADASGLRVKDSRGYFNPAAFVLPPPGRFGNAARNTIPGLFSTVANLAIARSFRLGEQRRRLEIRAECNNCANQVNINALGTVVNSTEYGLALGAQPMRTIVLHLRMSF